MTPQVELSNGNYTPDEGPPSPSSPHGFDNSYEPRMGLWPAFQKMLLTLSFCLVLQALGGLIMMGLEEDAEHKRLHEFKTHYAAIVDSMAMNDKNVSSEWRDREHEDMNNLLSVLETGSACHIPHEDDLKWNFAGGCFFSMTLFTTVGFGNFTPMTEGGRAFTCGYTLFGILAFASFIKAFGVWVNAQIHQIRQFQKARNHDVSALEPLSQEGRRVIGLVVCIFWIGLHSVWATLETPRTTKTTSGITESVYYAIISLTTVGLGDITPQIESGYMGVYVTVLFESVWLMFGLAIIAWFLDILGEEAQRQLKHGTVRLAHSEEVSAELNARLAVRLIASGLKMWAGPDNISWAWFEMRLNYLQDVSVNSNNSKPARGKGND